ncbi:MAG: hypothetical protein BroJett031_03260 [Betaproteobacteria bacterium]|nr:MAG: hypothetical protein BroJett031_03260 [Betaproteobacteria bacterium]
MRFSFAKAGRTGRVDHKAGPVRASPDVSRGTRELRERMRDAGCARGAQSNAQRHSRALERKPAPAGAAQTRVAPAIQRAFRLAPRKSRPKLKKQCMRGATS